MSPAESKSLYNEKAHMFAALGSARRLEIIDLLRIKARKPSELSSHLHITGPAVCRHLKILSDVGLVERDVTGHGVFFHLIADIAVADISDRAPRRP